MKFILTVLNYQQKVVRKPGSVPVSPEAIPPQYTVQFFGLDWFTTSSNLNCLVLAIRRKKSEIWTVIQCYKTF